MKKKYKEEKFLDLWINYIDNIEMKLVEVVNFVFDVINMLIILR